MDNRTRINFLILVLVQGLHSIEEYLGELWEVFPPATFLTSIVSESPEKGFLIINIALFIFGLGCWLILVIKKNNAFANGLIWFWIIIEIINGVGHSVWSLYTGGYTPGVATAPLLLLLAISLTWQHAHLKAKFKIV